MNLKLKYILLGSYFIALGLASGAVLSGDASEWLNKMHQAIAQKNYEGTFFHRREDKVESLYIIHRMREGIVSERLVSLDHYGREFIRRNNELLSFLPDQRVVVVEQQSLSAPLLVRVPSFNEATAAAYILKPVEITRLLEREVILVSITPLDEFRYGYRIWIDTRTAMPLKTELSNAQGEVLEQIFFTSLTLTRDIPDIAFAPSILSKGFRWIRKAEPDASILKKIPAAIDVWRAQRLPPGFRLMQRGRHRFPGQKDSVAHLVFSDGVAFVSVFIRDHARRARPEAATIVRIGASSSVSTHIDGYPVTVMGEVPPSTIKFIAAQLQLEGDLR